MYEGHPGEIDSVGSSDSARVELARVRGGGGGGGGGARGGVPSRVHEQQFCVSRLTKPIFTFLRFLKLEVV